MKCPKCQSEVPANARFCGECGESLAKAAPPPQAVDLSGLRTMDEMDTKAPRAAEQRMMQAGEIFAQRYEITQVIGEGGMGVVYRAHDKLTEKDVALKLIRADRLAGKDAVKRLIREGVTSRDIRHPNVVAVYDVGESDGQPYMSMEFLAGQSLRAWNRKRLQSSADVSMKTAANIVAEILSGLEAAHKAGVVHRDLKPENVMLVGEPGDQGATLKILDFGVARAAGAGDTGATSLGTRGYMAPEQITAPDAAQPSADLYSLSVMFYELLVGVVPQGHWQPPSSGRSDVPPAIDKLIERGLSNNPRARPQNVAEYGQALAEALKAGGAQATTALQWLEKLEKTDFKPIADTIRSNFDKLKLNPTPQPQAQPRPVSSQPAPQPQAASPPPSGMNLWQAFIFCLTKRYADGKGRASRMEYWGFVLFSALAAIVGVVADFEGGIGYVDYDGTAVLPITYLVSLALLAPLFAVTSRRLHDFGITGWAAIAAIIPLVALVIGLPEGNKADNQYGPDPLGGGGR